MKPFLTLLALLLQLSATAQVFPDSATVNPGPFQTAFPVYATPAQQAQPKVSFWQLHDRESRLLSRSLFVLAGSSTAGIIAYDFVDEPFREFTQLHRNAASNKVAAVFQPLGRSGYLLPAGGLVYASGLAFQDPKLQHTGLLLVSALLLNNLVTGKLKDEFQRRRPDEANHNTYFEGGEGGRHYASFPSAHTSTAFTFATSLATVYHDHKWVPPVAYSMATLVGLSRIHDNKHWTTDVLAGAAVGFVTAKTTNLILNQAEAQLAKHKVNIYLMPIATPNSVGLSLGGTL